MRWWGRAPSAAEIAKEVALSGFELKTITIAVGAKRGGWWQAAGGSAIDTDVARQLVTTAGETHTYLVRALILVPVEVEVGAIGGAVEPEALAGWGPGPALPQPRPHSPTANNPEQA